MMELPTGADFHTTTMIEHTPNIIEGIPTEKNVFKYRKCSINLRNIVDLIEYEMTANVIDESKQAEYEKEYEIWQKNNPTVKAYLIGSPYSVSPSPADQYGTLNGGEAVEFEVSPEGDMMAAHGFNESDAPHMPPNANFTPPPLMPLRKLVLKATLVTYFTGVQRILVDNFEEFQELYFNYLQKQRLDIGSN